MLFICVDLSFQHLWWRLARSVLVLLRVLSHQLSKWNLIRFQTEDLIPTTCPRSEHHPPHITHTHTTLHPLHRNTVPFTPTQVEAIRSGMQPGLTMVVGPPGTGKTDVAVQIISNLYHNFPDQRTLLVTHSNQALNQVLYRLLWPGDSTWYMYGHVVEHLSTAITLVLMIQFQNFYDFLKA